MSTRSTEADQGRRRRLVRQWRRSGLTAAEFAEAVGVSVRTLARWRREAESPRASANPCSAFVELVAMPATSAADGSAAEAPPTHAAHTSRATPISLRLGDSFELHLPPGFDADSLRRAVEVLQPLAGVGPRQICDAVRPEPAR
jgi:transcriptional regulator with XRE-family HTH domain